MECECTILMAIKIIIIINSLISRNAKIRHYQAVILPECLYASESLILNRNIGRLGLLERRILRRILGPNLTDDGWRLKSNKEIYQYTETILTAMNKRRLLFFGHLHRMNPDRLTKKIFDFCLNKKATQTWFQEIAKDLQLNHITTQDVLDRNKYRSQIRNIKEFQGEHRPPRTGTAWSQERKKEFSERMKAVWAERKKNKRN